MTCEQYPVTGTKSPESNAVRVPPSSDNDPAEIAKLLAYQVEKWYNGGKEKRDQICERLRSEGHDDLADELLNWYKMGDKRFAPLIERLNAFRVR